MAFSPPHETFVLFAEAFDGRGRSARLRPGFVSLSTLGRPHHYDPNQPRVPRGHSDGGQWTRGESSGDAVRSTKRRYWTRVASSDPPDPPDKAGKHLPPARRGGTERIRPRGGGFIGTIFENWLREQLEQERKKYIYPDLLGYVRNLKEGVIAISRFEGEIYFGVNSTFARYNGPYKDVDDRAAKQLRAALIAKYPKLLTDRNSPGRIPMNAVFHAETTLLLRVARAHGGMLKGKTLEILVERKPCAPSCEKLLPLIGLELGNPTVTFKSLKGEIRTMRDGEWKD